MKDFARIFRCEKRGQILVRTGASEEEKTALFFDFYADASIGLRATLGFKADSVEEASDILRDITLEQTISFIEEAMGAVASGHIQGDTVH